MNKRLQFSYWGLIALTAIMAVMALKTMHQLWQVNQINDYVQDPTIESREFVTTHPVSKLALSEHVLLNDEEERALDILTKLTSNKDKEVRTAAFFNRANIHLKQALAMQKEDRKHLPLVELAKQDYRSALLLNPYHWDARYNLEIALNIVPELPTGDGLFDKPDVRSQRSIEAVGFRVELP
jgi:mxaK protein